MQAGLQNDSVPILPDVLARGLDIVFCGTAAGRESARRRAYYAGRGNAFWPTLHAVGLTPVEFAPEDYARVQEHGLGLTDLAKYVSGSDADLSRSDFSRAALHAKLKEYRPRILAFTSKRAAEECVGHRVSYGVLAESIEGTVLFALTSPSGLARGHWHDAKFWRELAQLRLSLK